MSDDTKAELTVVAISLGVVALLYISLGSYVSAQEQPPAAWYAEVCYEATSAQPGQPVTYVMAEAFGQVHNSGSAQDMAREDAARAVREGICLRSERNSSGVAHYLDPPLCIPAARITSARAVPYREAE